jgi:EpsD family peptidyl-prolyl cis-trans isomerase
MEQKMGNTTACQRGSRLTLLVSASLLALALAGCGKSEPKAAGQVLARVNDKEITVLQLNAFLAQHPSSNPDHNAAQQQALDYLVDQEVLVQKAEALKLDRDPEVQQEIDMARRQILAAAAAHRVLATGSATPSTSEVHAFYLAHPDWFAQRKLYDCVAFVMPRAALSSSVSAQLNQSHSANDTQDVLNGASVTFKTQNLQLLPERLPAPMLASLKKMQPGDILTLPSGASTTLLQLVKSESAAVSESAAQPAIEAFIARARSTADGKSKLSALKHDASISDVHQFIDATASKSQANSYLQNGVKGL